MKLIVAVAAMMLATTAMAQQTDPTAQTSTGTAGGIRPDTQDPQPRGGAVSSMHHRYRHAMHRRHHHRRHHVTHHHVMHHDDTTNAPSQ